MNNLAQNRIFIVVFAIDTVPVILEAIYPSYVRFRDERVVKAKFSHRVNENKIDS